MKINSLHLFFSTLVLFGTTGCQIDTSSDGSGGKDSLVNILAEPAGTNCPFGGQQIQSGLDSDNSGTLEESEVETVSYVCSGQNVIANISDEPAGDNCADGGKRVDSGIDLDNSGTLEAEEISVTSYICNGSTGPAGPTGTNSLVNVTVEPAGNNCPTGGFRIDSGVDDNANTILEAGEIDGNPQYLCNGEQGIAGLDGAAGATGATGVQGASSLLLITMEAEGNNCALGGYRIASGIDDNGNSVLDGNEVDHTSFLCNEKPKETPLNDTGIISESVDIGGAAPTYQLQSCATFPMVQDCGIGWDRLAWDGLLWKIGAGADGFDFTKINALGDDIPIGMEILEWECARDNLTNLVWEVKKADGTGYRARDRVVNLADANISVATMNSNVVCGFNDWRLPTLKELHGLVDYEVFAAPYIDSGNFNYTNSIEYWTIDARDASTNLVVDFNTGQIKSLATTSLIGFRAVRGGL